MHMLASFGTHTRFLYFLLLLVPIFILPCIYPLCFSLCFISKRHAPATTNGLKDIWQDSIPSGSGRRNRSGPLLSQIDIGDRINSSHHLEPSDLSDLPLIEFTIPPPILPHIDAEDPEAQEVAKQAAAALIACVHDRCVICLGSFQPNDQLRALPCHHAFHKNCIDTWLLGKRNDSKERTNFCPTCRCVIIPRPPAPVMECPTPSSVQETTTVNNMTHVDKGESAEGNEGVEEGVIPAWSYLLLGARLHKLDMKT
mmetsp:Transcript_15304/g.19856  ORF Transcript_15304/g.19856 Transcript_15304/m.19856 type:complete len:255 (+) Transcript_15304:239-1003(+)